MGTAASTRTLAQATIRRYSQAKLDLGTGSGILSLLAAAHSERVVALDSNPRAIAMAQLNARLNDVTNIEFLEGDIFEPVAGLAIRFDRLQSPFVIAPVQVYLHSHSDMPLDRFCEALVRTAPGFLTEGGYCQIVCNWVQLVGKNWQKRLESWLIEAAAMPGSCIPIQRMPLTMRLSESRTCLWARSSDRTGSTPGCDTMKESRLMPSASA